MNTTDPTQCDVLIIGAGLAGLTLARHLLLVSGGKKIVMVERRELPNPRQKVGEATVQMSGYYYSRVLEMEEHLLRHHYMKYNLRFIWSPEDTRTADADPADYYDYSQSYIRKLSNIVTYQLDRNVFEEELTRVNRAHPDFTLHESTRDLEIQLSENGENHTFRFRAADGSEIAGTTRWVVDASGRGKFLKRRLGLERQSPVRHGTTFLWVDGLVDIEKLSPHTPQQQRVHPHRTQLGHTPEFLATNHFCGEGFWFWTIPLHGKTSLGLVYDNRLIRREDIGTPKKLIEWICKRFPIFARDLPQREIVDHGGFVDYAFDAHQTLSADRWALCGEACRFADPLYSPGGDLISMYNTLICDAICGEEAKLPQKVRLYEQLARSIYEAYLPSFAVSYETLGDREVFSLRYVWELTIYFGFYVFPFINDLFTDPTFGVGFLRRFSRLGPINRGLHKFLLDFYQWKKEHPEPGLQAPVYLDFMEFGHLRAAEECFYKVGVSSEEARQVLDEQLENLEELARALVSHITAVVTGDRRARSRDFVRAIPLDGLRFDPAAMAGQLAAIPQSAPEHEWMLDVPCLDRYRGTQRPQAKATEADGAEAGEMALAAGELA